MLLVLFACGRQNFSDRIDAPPRDGIGVDADLRLPGLLAWYAMEDDPSDGILDDDGGNARVARCIGGVSCPTQVAGKHGNAVAFNGMQGARVTYGPWLATPNAYAYSAWIYLDTLIDQVAFAKPYGASSLDSWGITAWAPQSTAGTCFETVNAAVTNEDVCGPMLTTGRWFHIAARWDGSVKALFIDGIKVGERTNATSSLVDTHDMLIGGDENSGSPAYQFHGMLDELQIFDRALGESEILMLAAP